MTSTKALTSPALITKAEAATGAIEDLIRKAATDWSAAYAAVAKDRKTATAKAIADSLPKGSGCSSPATITDMERAARIADPAAWAALWRLPVPTNGARVTTLHGLIAKARKAARGVGPVDEAIGKALDAVAQAANADDDDKRAARIARAYSGLVNALNTLKPPAAPPVEPDADTDPADVVETEPETETEPPTLDARALRLAGECDAVRTILIGGGASITSDALVALQREAASLARDVARILAAKDAKADAA